VTRVLVTGFEPFGEHEVNPSALLAEALDGVVLPVSYARAADALRAAIDERDPELVICFGLAHTRTEISVERFALNLDDAEAADNDGVTSASLIDPGGPVAYRSTLPVDEIVAALRADGIPAGTSRDAGGYLCNHVFYSLMRALPEGARGGFIHVPPLDVLPLETLGRAAGIVVAVASL
jgi:pyroglutamyl-peptidase